MRPELPVKTMRISYLVTLFLPVSMKCGRVQSVQTRISKMAICGMRHPVQQKSMVLPISFLLRKIMSVKSSGSSP
ncbi:hypothetical protein D9M70_611350 [compost metagenome]